ncbi:MULTISPECIES: hydrogenase maturation nickel metallochaperone HypA/HybF [unclassified Butyrivibrio]|uniref:hydrogenase maturation nickel metallochaperone HypA/HybF n=1 Tax=unclassified Butyrivibrio TaxID=2639466 RepID=UPI0003F76213|nr:MULTISPECIES: hydrogenase maturation nickel metallochaperone HypA [unclassified Butyrivibrio]
MHELSYIIDIVNTVLDETKNRSIKKVKKIEVDVGEMSGVIPYYLHKYYPEVVAGTELNDTVLVTNEIEVKIKCEECGNIYHPEKEFKYRCPKCNNRSGNLVSGKGIQIKSIEIEE